ncbi:hypothetical protein RLOatenuis_4390 [Rickettsiales bacterium]|nr:hypothetical protein RLOatenuis_4390 [Rickettsiales bacterium]
MAHASTKKKISITLVFLLVFAFVFTGFGLANKTPSTYVAKVGSKKITYEEYNTAYENELRHASQALGVHLAAEQIAAFKIRENALNRLIQKKLIGILLEKAGLDIDDEIVASQAKSYDYFKNSQGRFDVGIFEQILRKANMSKQRFYQEVKNDMLGSTLMRTLFDFVPDMKFLAQEMYRYKSQRRMIDLITIPNELVLDLEQPEPNETALLSFYKENQQRYIAPERREINYLIIDREIVGAGALRDIVSAAFQTEQEARAALELLRRGTLHIDNAELKQAKFDQVTAESLAEDLPADVAEAAFATAEHEFSEVIKTDSGWYVVWVARAYSVDEKLNELNDFVENLDEKLMQGMSLQELAESHNMALSNTTAMDAYGYSADGERVVPFSREVLAQIFKADLNVCSSFVRLDGGYVAFTVTGVHSARVLTLDEARELVISEYKDAMKAEKLESMAYDLAEEMQGRGMEVVAREYGIEPPRSVSLDMSNLDYPALLMSEVFSAKQGQLTRPVKHQDGFVVALVRQVQYPTDSDASVVASMEQNLAGGVRESLYMQLMRHLASRHRIKIYEPKLKSIVSDYLS